MDQLEKYLRALVLLELDSRRDANDTADPQILLSRAGFTGQEVAHLLNKKLAAVQKAVQRARQPARRSRS